MHECTSEIHSIFSKKKINLFFVRMVEIERKVQQLTKRGTTQKVKESSEIFEMKKEIFVFFCFFRAHF